MISPPSTTTGNNETGASHKYSMKTYGGIIINPGTCGYFTPFFLSAVKNGYICSANDKNNEKRKG
jgi:hypothetical protein